LKSASKSILKTFTEKKLHGRNGSSTASKFLVDLIIRLGEFMPVMKLNLIRKSMNSLSILPIALLFTSCASIVSKSQWPVSLTSSPTGCQVSVKNASGIPIHQATTPCVVTLPSSAGFFQAARYQIEFSKKGLPTQTVSLSAELNGWYLGNILFGGIIGILIVDPATGAMWKLPESSNVSLSAVATLSNGNGKSIKIVDKTSIPADLQKQLIAIR